MAQDDHGHWRCLAHSASSNAWAVAESLGAHPPCVIPRPISNRLRVASAKSLGASTARILVNDPSGAVRARLAANERAPIPVLHRLAGDSLISVLCAVASNKRAFPQDVALLAQHSDWSVRAAAARNAAASPDLLKTLAHDPHTNVRFSAARNPATYARTLEALVGTSLMLTALAGNIGASSDLLHAVLRSAAKTLQEHAPISINTSLAAAQNPNASSSILDQLAQHPDARVRRAAVSHPAASPETVRRLLDDPDHDVYVAAVTSPCAPLDAVRAIATSPIVRRFSQQKYRRQWAALALRQRQQ